MKYFKVKQDKKLRNLIQIEGFQGCPDIVLDRNMAEDINACTTLYVKGNEASLYPDLIQSPVLLISEKMYQVLKYYDTVTIYKIVVLTDLKNKRQEVYRLMLPQVEDALGDKTKYDHNGLLAKISISSSIDLKKKIFYVSEGKTHHLIVAQDVLESMLARSCIGICFEELEEDT